MEHNDIATSQIRLLMRNVPYFAELDAEALNDLMQWVQVRKLPAGHTIFLKGEGQGEAPFYLVVEGRVRAYLSSMRGREQVLRLFHPGDTFGEVPLFDGGPYPASTEAMTDVVLASVPRQEVLRLMKMYPELAIRIVNVMAGRLRHFNVLIEDLSLRRVVSRVARLLAEGQSSELTQAQMATMVGSSREMVNRSLHRLEDDGILDLNEAGAITILDLERLVNVIDQA